MGGPRARDLVGGVEDAALEELVALGDGVAEEWAGGLRRGGAG